MNRYSIPAFAFLLFGVDSSAQTLTASSNTPVIGDSYQVYTVNAFTDPGSSGAGAAWDFSTLSNATVVNFHYFDPSTSQYAAQFPDAQWVVTNELTDTLFYKATANGLEQVGEDALYASYDVQCHMSDPELRLALPCSLGTTWSDVVAANYDIDGNATVRTGGITGECDGAGTVTMPYGQVIGVLRIHTRLQQNDQIGFIGATHNRDEWVYMAEWLKFPLVRIVSDTITIPAFSVQQVTRTTEWLGGASVGHFEQQASGSVMSVFPNPAADNVNVRFAEQATGNMTMELCDATGRVVLSQRAIPGVQQQVIDLSEVAPGAYMLNLTRNGKVITSARVLRN